MKPSGDSNGLGVITHGMDAPETFAVGDVVAVCGGRRRHGIVDRIRVAPGKLAVVVRWGTIQRAKVKAPTGKVRTKLTTDGEPAEFFVYDPKGQLVSFKLREDGRWLRRKDDAGCGLYCFWHREGRWANPHAYHR